MSCVLYTSGLVDTDWHDGEREEMEGRKQGKTAIAEGKRERERGGEGGRERERNREREGEREGERE